MIETDSPRIVALVVDDEADHRELAVRALRAAGIDVVALDGGAAAIAACDAGLRPTVIVLDIQMPECSGWDVWDWLQRSRLHVGTPVVFWTAMTLSSKALNWAVIVKKGSLPLLVETVKAVIDGRSRAEPVAIRGLPRA